MVVFTYPEVQVFSDTLKNLKVIKTDEIEVLFRGKRAILSSKSVENIANIIFTGYGKGQIPSSVLP